MEKVVLIYFPGKKGKKRSILGKILFAEMEARYPDNRYIGIGTAECTDTIPDEIWKMSLMGDGIKPAAPDGYDEYYTKLRAKGVPERLIFFDVLAEAV